MKKFIKLFKNDYALLAFILGQSIFFLKTPWAVIVGSALIFTAFDAQGYFKTLQRRETNDTTEDPEIIAAYRIIQLQYQVSLLFTAYILQGWVMPVTMLIWHFSGANDTLYYFLLKQKIPAKITWLWWTPAGFYFEVLKKKFYPQEECFTPRWVLLIQSLVGIIIATFIIYKFFGAF